MNKTLISTSNPTVGAALQELQGIIEQRYPTAIFAVSEGDDPEGIYMWVTVDVEDTDDIVDLVIDRLLELQIEHELPVYVIPVRPAERAATTRSPVVSTQGRPFSLI